MRTSDKSLDSIAGALGWIAFWLFFIAIASCGEQTVIIKTCHEDSDDFKASAITQCAERFESALGFDGKGATK